MVDVNTQIPAITTGGDASTTATTVTVEATPNATTVVTNDDVTQTQTTSTVADDLLTRTAAFEKENPVKDVQTDKDFHFNVNDIESIQDPQSKEYVQKAYKSLQKGFNDKFQEIAELRKAYEAQQSQPTVWTADKVQALIKDDNFVQVARQLESNMTSSAQSEEYSTLTDTEKARFDTQQKEINFLKQQLVSGQNQSQHTQLSEKYANYNSQAIDTLKADLIAGKVQATNEHLYKVVSHDDNVNRAYEMGRKDEREGRSDQIQSVSIDSQTSTTPAPVPVVKEEGETSKQLWRRISEKAIQAAGTHRK